MKRILSIALCVVLAAAAAVIFSACGEEEDLVASTVNIEDTTEAATSNDSEGMDLTKLHEVNYEGDPFAGAWKISEGDGTKYTSFVYVFDGNKKAYLIIGTTGYIENYKIGTDESGKDTFTAKMMFGINGTYYYEFSDEGNTLLLTNTEDNSKTTLTKLASFSYIPLPDPEPVIDEDLLGAWKDDSGEYYYFDKSGIMYNSRNNLSFTFSKYSAKDGKVVSTYTTNTEETTESEYSVSGDTLTFDGYPYTKISEDELK